MFVLLSCTELCKRRSFVDETAVDIESAGHVSVCLSLFCCVLLCVLSSFAVILKRKRELVGLRLLSYRCLVTVHVL